jgi:glutamate/tyrosine decarboxylase-like PLP-dependent enzyme
LLLCPIPAAVDRSIAGGEVVVVASWCHTGRGAIDLIETIETLASSI